MSQVEVPNVMLPSPDTSKLKVININNVRYVCERQDQETVSQRKRQCYHLNLIIKQKKIKTRGVMVIKKK